MAAVSMALGASGSLSSAGTTKLLTASEGMAAMRKASPVLAGYKPPTN